MQAERIKQQKIEYSNRKKCGDLFFRGYLSFGSCYLEMCNLLLLLTLLIFFVSKSNAAAISGNVVNRNSFPSAGEKIRLQYCSALLRMSDDKLLYKSIPTIFGKAVLALPRQANAFSLFNSVSDKKTTAKS